MNKKELFEQVTREYLDALWDSLPEGDIELSSEYKEKKKALIASIDSKDEDERKEKRKRKHITINMNVLRRVACILLVISVLSIGITVSADRTDTPSLDVNSTNHGLKIDNSEVDTAYDTIMHIYLPKLDESYKRAQYFAQDYLVYASWTCQSGNTLEFSQMTADSSEYIQEKEYTIEKFAYDGLEYVYYSVNGKNTIMWNDIGYCFSLSSQGFSKDELAKLSENLIYSGKPESE